MSPADIKRQEAKLHFNPIHTIFRDGGDQPRDLEAVAESGGYGGSDDWVVMPLPVTQAVGTPINPYAMK